MFFYSLMKKIFKTYYFKLIIIGAVYFINAAKINNTGFVFAKEAGFKSIQDKIYVDEYYKRATPANDPKLPESLKWMPFTGRGVDENKTEIIPVKGNSIPLNWDEKGSFSHDLFKGEYSRQIITILEKYGVNLKKLTNLLKKIGTEKGVSMYDSGYIIIFDGNVKKAYIIKTKPKIALAVEKIEFDLVPKK